MWRPERVIGVLRDRGELWEAAPGLIGLRGDAWRLYRALARAVTDLARAEAEDEWRVPPGIGLDALARAEYFASFPQWLTLASHLSDDPAALERVAAAAHPAAAARAAAAPADAALPPAVCYHAYAALAGTTLEAPRLLTAEASCWRHEGARLRPLERGWAFTMREIVYLGPEAEAAAFRQRGVARAWQLADALGLSAEIVEAADPFFAPTARGKALLQRVKALKHELVLPLAADGSRPLACASVNLHEQFFGEAFAIRLLDGRPATTACVAFGLERWLLAFLVAHGPNAARWPALEPVTASGVLT